MDKKIQTMLETISAQRNQALDTIVMLNGEIAELQEKLEKLSSKADEDTSGSAV